MKPIKYSTWLHRILHLFRIRFIISSLLQYFPIKRKLANNIIYLIASVEGFPTAREIYSDDVYRPVLEAHVIESFIDLGCNAGYIACLLASEANSKEIKGVMVDANKDMVSESEWHLTNNELNKCEVIWGAVSVQNSTTCNFNISEYNISSSAKAFDEKYPISNMKFKQIQVPVVRLRELIDYYFRDEVIDFLKIDIEGSEKELLEGNLEFLNPVKNIVVEWHKWVVEFSEIKSRLEQAGFCLSGILKEDSVCGLAYFENTSEQLGTP